MENINSLSQNLNLVNIPEIITKYYLYQKHIQRFIHCSDVSENQFLLL
jgi:hypothetical protein